MRHEQHIDESYGAGRDAALRGDPIHSAPVAPDDAFRAWITGYRDYQAFNRECAICGGSGTRTEVARAYSLDGVPCDCNIGAPCLSEVTPAWPEHWTEVWGTTAVVLERELTRELCPAHHLHNVERIIRAQRPGRDDVLVCPRTASGPVYWVHLTWHAETDPTWPWTEAYSDVADFVERWPEEELDDLDDPGGEAG